MCSRRQFIILDLSLLLIVKIKFWGHSLPRETLIFREYMEDKKI